MRYLTPLALSFLLFSRIAATTIISLAPTWHKVNSLAVASSSTGAYWYQVKAPDHRYGKLVFLDYQVRFTPEIIRSERRGGITTCFLILQLMGCE